MAIDPAELIASDVALDIYLSGWASGAKSAFDGIHCRLTAYRHAPVCTHSPKED